MISENDRDDARLIWEFHRMGHESKPCSVAVGLGSHDIGVAEATADLYFRGLAPLIVFTGATSRTTADRMPRGEAEHYKKRAVELGVPASRILVEPNARNTGENLQLTRRLLHDADVPVTSVLLVSKPYEERRAYATAKQVWPDVEIVSASAAIGYDEYARSIGDERLVIDMLVGALQRLLIYPEQGFMIHQDVPKSVRAAYERLVEAGYKGRLLRQDS
ncbi:YdcF family protein [Streptomyces fungicidicus]|uniref:YdcF family protein n=1 Tax=Streptomyces fungicidicus TaxID=68203 RepID=A0ACC7Y8P5_9ACTN|nr:YdcF family protein [Streptomyces fungicidicus]NUV78158.1 YdcF family protein [Streptomyces fungicidicus]